jgi:hypothetical protein
MKTYNSRYISFLVLGSFAVATIFFIYLGVDIVRSSGNQWFYVIFMCLVVLGWYQYLRMPFEIKIADNQIEFRSLLKKTIVTPRDIKSIKSFGGMVKIKHAQGSLMLYTYMNGFHEFISTVKSLNPAIDFKGV